MSKVYEGDEWKRADNNPSRPFAMRRLTRAESQRKLDDQFIQGLITVDQWRLSFDCIGMTDRAGNPITGNKSK